MVITLTLSFPFIDFTNGNNKYQKAKNMYKELTEIYTDLQIENYRKYYVITNQRFIIKQGINILSSPISEYDNYGFIIYDDYIISKITKIPGVYIEKHRFRKSNHKYSEHFNLELDFCNRYLKEISFNNLNYEEILEIEKVIEKLKIKVLKRKLLFGDLSPA